MVMKSCRARAKLSAPLRELDPFSLADVRVTARGSQQMRHFFHIDFTWATVPRHECCVCSCRPVIAFVIVVGCGCRKHFTNVCGSPAAATKVTFFSTHSDAITLGLDTRQLNRRMNG